MPQQIKSVSKKSKRRGNNEGSIFQRKDGRWVAQVTVGYKSNGKAIYKYAYGATRQEVARQLIKYTQQVFENGYTSFAASDTHNFYSLLEDWYVTFKEPNIKSTTSEKLRNFMKNQIKPELGNVDIENLDLFRFQRYFNGLAKKGICLDSIKKIRQLISQFYQQYALKMKLVQFNPLDDVKIRGNERNDAEKENLALSPDLRAIIFEKLEQEPILCPILTTLMLTGMRPGELIALRWKDISFEKSVISIRLAISRDIEFDDNGEVVSKKQIISNTKTLLSVRSFVVSESAMNCLEQWKAYLYDQEEKTGIDFTSDNCYVFSTKEGSIRSYYGLRSMLNRFLERHGLDKYSITLYTFRHTFATILLEERENPKIVSELMGHAKVTTTLSIYSHIISKTVYEDTARTLDRAFKAVKGQNKTDEPPNDSSVSHDTYASKIDS